jgi:CO/xanthine dehydrogenase Mo-binding subunit
MDPIAFRIKNLGPTDRDRFLTVIDEVSKAAGWQPRVSASNLSDGAVVRGRGVGVVPSGGSLVAAIADVEVNKKTGKIVPKHLYIGIDAGLTVNPTAAKRQLIGGAVQAISWTLIEQAVYNKHRVTSLDWVTYPILRFRDSPKVTALVIQRPEIAAAGVGEEAQPATIGAIANAFFDATGVRLRDAPMTPGRVRGVLKGAGMA